MPVRPDPDGLRVGQELELRIEKGVYRGLGLARHEGRVIFVPRAFPDERLRARVTDVERGFARAVAEATLEPSPGRRPAPCPHAERCGGCVYQELDYTFQVALKRDILAEALRRAGVAFDGAIDVAAGPETGWRTRATFHFDARADGLRLGLHEEGTHSVVDIERCLQLTPAMDEAMRGLKQALSGRRDLWSKLRNLHLASGLDAGLVATLETSLAPAEVAALVPLRSAAPGLTGFAALTEEQGRPAFVLLHGSPWLGHRVSGLALKSHARAFFQGNRFLVEDLVRCVLDLAPADRPALDLYAGVGIFALTLARRGQAVRAVEADEIAADDARENARRLSISGFRMETSDVRRALAAWPAEKHEVVILDPPRTGAGLDVVELIAARRPRAVVYVSCDPPTLGRDLAHFAKQGYRMDALRAFDMFPDTFHVEAVVRLVPAA
jgi:23S rRNA (uracil1939-C5)-methyltransferase